MSQKLFVLALLVAAGLSPMACAHRDYDDGYTTHRTTRDSDSVGHAVTHALDDDDHHDLDDDHDFDRD